MVSVLMAVFNTWDSMMLGARIVAADFCPARQPCAFSSNVLDLQFPVVKSSRIYAREQHSRVSLRP